MSGVGVLLVGLAIAVGIVGVVVPVLPGALLVWAAIAVWAFAVGSATAWAVLAVVSVVIGGAQVVKLLVPGRQLRNAGVPRRTIVVGLVLWTEVHYAPAYWVHAALWGPLTLGLTLGLLQPVKGAIVALQWKLGMHGFGMPKVAA